MVGAIYNFSTRWKKIHPYIYKKIFSLDDFFNQWLQQTKALVILKGWEAQGG